MKQPVVTLKYSLVLSLSGSVGISSWISVSRAFLYGSYARNEASPDSDIDILIVSPVFDDQNDLLKIKVWRLTEKVNNKIEPYIIGLRKFTTDDVSPLLQVVKREGIEIPV